MFRFSSNWLKKFCGEDITYNKISEILNLQGFEVKGEQKINSDTIVTIEVKANRADMLSHIGVSREICAYLGKNIPEIPKCNVKTDNKIFPININVESADICKRFSGICINNIDNSVETPEYIKNYLNLLGINCINAVVDIANYVMIELGQPLHTYDMNKICGNELNVLESNSDCDIITLGNKVIKAQKGNIIISDHNKPLCVAGIIGAENSTVQKSSQNILIESAVFNEVKVRIASRNMKVSTPSSFRFERGIDESQTINVAMCCAEMINKICKGTICDVVYDYYPNPKPENKIMLRTSRNNSLLGINLNQSEIKKYIEKYDFKCKTFNDDALEVTCPKYRLDLIKEVDLIEEVARIYGYDNIEPRMPKVEIQYNNNETWSNMDKLRHRLCGMNFNEIITYSFIPSNSMELLGIDESNRLYSNMTLKNPIAPAYTLMRPTLLYSLVNCLAYNYSRNNTDLALFEIGRTYFKDVSSDTGCKEIDTLGIIISGNRISRGWGMEKDIKYTYYDILNYLQVLFKEFNQKYCLKQFQYPFFEDGTGLEILIENQIAGFIGEVKKSFAGKIPNAKLIKDKMFYCEIYLKYLHDKHIFLGFESKYPPVRRSYNLVYNKSINVKDVINIMKKSSQLIRNIEIIDIYEKGMLNNQHAVLFELNYCSGEETLTSEQIQDIENIFLKELLTKLDVVLKQ